MSDSELAIALEPFRRVPGGKDTRAPDSACRSSRRWPRPTTPISRSRAARTRARWLRSRSPRRRRRSSGQPWAAGVTGFSRRARAGRMITCTPRSDASLAVTQSEPPRASTATPPTNRPRTSDLELIGERLGHPRRKAGDRQAVAARAGKAALADPLAPSAVRETDAIFEPVGLRFQREAPGSCRCRRLRRHSRRRRRCRRALPICALMTTRMASLGFGASGGPRLTRQSVGATRLRMTQAWRWKVRNSTARP